MRNSSNIVWQTQIRVKKLAQAETSIVRICAQTLDLIEQTDFSVALPPALQSIRGSGSGVADRLDGGMADAPLVSDEKQIESDLADLLETFKQLASQPGPPSQCRGCKGNKNKLLAELKVLRVLQNRVNGRTTATDAERQQFQTSAAGQPGSDLREKITGISVSQADVQAAAEKIHHELSGE